MSRLPLSLAGSVLGEEQKRALYASFALHSCKVSANVGAWQRAEQAFLFSCSGFLQNLWKFEDAAELPGQAVQASLSLRASACLTV